MFDFATVDTAHSSYLLNQNHSFTDSFHQNDYAIFANFKNNSRQLSTWETDYFYTTSLPTLSLQANDTQAAETLTGQTANPGQFTFTRTGDLTKALTAYYSVTGTATNGQDYDILTGSVNFAVGASTARINIRPIDDTLFEGNESVTLTLVNNASYSVGTAKTGTVTITDNDKPTLTLTANDSNATETLTGQIANSGQFTLTRNGNLSNTLTAYYTVTGTATNGTDYQNLTGSVTFTAGSSTAIINLNVLDDALVEGNETVTLTLANNANYILGTTQTGTITIADNDTSAIPNLDWTRQLGTSLKDAATEIITDAQGNVYMAGFVDVPTSEQGSRGETDAWVAKYDVNGQQQWFQWIATPYYSQIGNNIYYARFSEQATGLALDESGNLYITGTRGLKGLIAHENDPSTPNDNTSEPLEDSDIFLAKFTSNGQMAWDSIKYFNEFDYDLASADDIAVDRFGNAYISGQRYTGAEAGALVLKYDTNGNLQGGQYFGDKEDDANAIAVDAQGNIYVAGSYERAFNDGTSNFLNKNLSYDAWLIKFNSNFEIEWSTGVANTLNYDDRIRELALDGNGNLYLVGSTSTGSFVTGESSQFLNSWLVKYNTQGQHLWTHTEQKTNQEGYIYTDVVTDAQGKVYVGATRLETINTTSSFSQATVTQFDSNGLEQWEKRLGTSTNSAEGYGLALGSNGTIYQTGVVYGSLDGSTYYGNGDILLGKYR